MNGFYMVEKRGSKWVAVAKISYPKDATTCIARAASDLRELGYGDYHSRYVWVASIKAQKNFAGEVENIPSFIGVGGKDI